VDIDMVTAQQLRLNQENPVAPIRSINQAKIPHKNS